MSSVKRLAFATAGITGIWIVTFTALLLLGALAVPAAVVAVGVSIAVAILVLLGARWRAQTVAAVEPGRTGRRVLAVSVVATLGVGAFIAIYAAQLIPGNRYLGLFLAQLAFVLALIAIAGAAATGFSVVRWRNGSARRWAVRIAVAMAIYLALIGALFGQVYVLALAAGYGLGAYHSRRPAASGAVAT